MSDRGREALQALLERIALEDDVVGVVLADAAGAVIAAAGELESVDLTLADQDPDELEHFERDALGATAIAPGGPYGVRRQLLLEGRLRLVVGFELGADLDAIKAVGQQAGLEA